ncbi:50S ribosomal protein L33 [Mammaliicoccus sciuri]|uniref:Large ribosomal subunit protein bL33 n=1 Tax=Sporosarcina newyorkensis TaxID=759851 RepID=A0A1T4YQH6_9BACL|nr:MULTISPECIES: 50S ribosomal protein L33 [Sporosarcina]MBY0221344.1 50S ribosomal protein L33 [Sporosarcina aquimarina]SKB03923.1 LSU ribosomal protein L33P [Sporosarcina newyorkensis]
MVKKIIICCENCGSRNYTLPAGNQGRDGRIVIKKFCSHCNAHTLHKQTI